MPNFNKIKKLLGKREEELALQEEGNFMPPYTGVPNVEMGMLAEEAGKNMDKQSALQKVLSAQSWDRASKPYGPPQSEDLSPEELVRSKQLSSAVMGSFRSMDPKAVFLKPDELMGLAARAKGNDYLYSQLRNQAMNKSRDVAMKSNKNAEEVEKALKDYFNEHMPERMPRF